MAGRLIALEGLDGAGRTTQCGLLVAALRARGLPAHATAEPTAGPVGGLLRLALGWRLGRYARDGDGEAGGGEAAFVPLDPRVLALLFAADRLDHLTNEVEPLLAAGATVVSDRYVLSSLAYQGLEVDVDWLKEINSRARPADLTLYLDVPPEVAVRRIVGRGGRQEVFEPLETLRRIHDNYQARLAELRAAGAAVHIIPGLGSVEEVTKALAERALA